MSHFFDEAELLGQIRMMIAERRKAGDAVDDAETRMYENVLLPLYSWFVGELNRGTKPSIMAQAIVSLMANGIDTFASTVCEPPEDRACIKHILELVQHVLDTSDRDSIVGHAMVGGHA